MAYTSIDIDPGTTPSAPILVDDTSGGNAQGVKLIDATAGSTTPTGVGANPFKVQQRTRGAADYDSGLSAVPTSSTAVTTLTTYVDTVLVTNTTASELTFTLTNTANTHIFSAFPVAPNNSHVMQLGGMEYLGLKWQASGSGVNAHIRGWQ